MKRIEVVAAIIYKDGADFATQRGYGEFEGMWEFPGGKIEAGESCEDALKREIEEELGVDIVVGELLCTVQHTYPSFHLMLHCYMCNIASGVVELREHKSAQWLTPEMLDSVQWLPADIEVVNILKKGFILI